MSNSIPNSTIEQSEEWRDIPGYDGSYQASSLGRIRNVISGEITFGTRRIYYTYYIRSAHRAVMVHRLVALAFLGKCPRGVVVNHKDLNKHNNRISNLEYVSKSRNAQHAADHYRNATPEAIQSRQANIIGLRAAGWSYRDIAHQFSMTTDEVREITRKNAYLRDLDEGKGDYEIVPERIRKSAFDCG